MISQAPPAASPSSSFEERRSRVAHLTAEHCARHYTEDGKWSSSEIAPDLRKAFWLCFGLFANESPASHALANAILESATFVHHSRTRTPEEAASSFDIFITNHAVQMLVVHGSKLKKSVTAKLEGWARFALKSYPGDRQADYQFHGANDNMPAKATLGLILGGEYFGDDEAVAHGLWNLRQLRELLTRRGLISEYTSPTYSALTLVNLTEIMLHARHPEAARLAELCVERIWADVLGHFHPPTRTMAGPYSRAYELDSTAHFSTSACLLWLALGEKGASFDPIEELRRDTVRIVHHHSDRTTQIGVLAWLISCPIYPPAKLCQWLDSRTYPFHLSADSERIAREASEVHTTLYAEENFALGTSFGETWTAGQSEAFFLQYVRDFDPKQSGADITQVRTAYARYLIDDQQPQSTSSMLKPHSLVHTIHKGRSALVLARPQPSLAADAHRSLRFSIVIPTHFGEVEHIEVKSTLSGPWVFVSDGTVHLAFLGLNSTQWSDDATQTATIEHADDGDYLVISFPNYSGPERRFAEDEIIRTLNGFVAIIGVVAEESFSTFKKRALASRILNYYAFDQRTITWELDDTRLSACYAPGVNAFRFLTIDGQPVPRPRWAADGLPESELPFLDGKAALNPLSSFPYDHMRVVWAPEKPWQIAARPQN